MESIISSGEEITETFHKLEKKCIEYDNGVDNDDKNYIKTLEDLRKLITEIQRQSIFSNNEELPEVHTENLKLMMAPYYQADLLFRIMENRAERVKMAQVFYIEYLRMLNHYGVLEKEQIQVWKMLIDKHKVAYTMSRSDAMPEEIKEAQEMLKEI